MKKIIIAMMAAVSLLNFSGCDSLDMEPVSSISDANYWKSPDQFKAFNIGLHDCSVHNPVITYSYWANLARTSTEISRSEARLPKA